MAQKIHAGYGSFAGLEPQLKAAGPTRVMLCTGRGSYATSGAERLVDGALATYSRIRFQDIDPNPNLAGIERGLAAFREAGCDYLLAIGGGSVIDTAKAIALLAAQPGAPVEYVRGRSAPRPRRVGLTAVPTTAGTGSESTHFSVVYIGAEKHSLAHPSMVPDCAILDPTLTLTLPPDLTATSGMDALCQAVESFWSVNSTDESQELSRKAIPLALGSIEAAVNHPDRRARENMLLASNLAGRAINLAKTTAAHAVSYPLTARFAVPHGQAVALTLPWFVELNWATDAANCQDPRGHEHVRQVMTEVIELLAAPTAAGARERLVQLMHRIGLEVRLSCLGIGEADIDAIVQHGLGPARAANNPRRVGPDELRTLLRRIL